MTTRSPIHEAPLIRLKFQAPDGSAQSASINCSWSDEWHRLALTGNSTDPKSVMFKHKVAAALANLMTAQDCELLSIDIIGVHYVEL